MPQFARLSFSLIYTEDKDNEPRTLDLTCKNEQEFMLWFWGIQVSFHTDTHRLSLFVAEALCTALHCIAFVALHSTALYCIGLHCYAVNTSSLHQLAVKHFAA